MASLKWEACQALARKGESSAGQGHRLQSEVEPNRDKIVVIQTLVAAAAGQVCEEAKKTNKQKETKQDAESKNGEMYAESKLWQDLPLSGDRVI